MRIGALPRRIRVNMHWLRTKLAIAKAALTADALAERVVWWFVLANFLLLFIAFVVHDVGSNSIASALAGALMTAGSLWLIPVWLFRIVGVSRLRASISIGFGILLFASMATAAFDTGGALTSDDIDPGSAAWIALSTLVLLLFRGVWQPMANRPTSLARVLKAGSAAAICATIALWAGTTLHPFFQMTLNGPLRDLDPARVANAERYLLAASELVAAIPIEPVVVFLALAVLTIGVKAVGRSFRIAKRISTVLTFTALAMLGLTSFSYVTTVAAPMSLERVSKSAHERIARYRRTHDNLVMRHAVTVYLTENPIASRQTKRATYSDANRICHEYNEENGVESDVPDSHYRYYDNIIGDDYQWFNLGSKTINCEHREYYLSYVRAIRAAVRIGTNGLDLEIPTLNTDPIATSFDEYDRARTTGSSLRPGALADLVGRSQKMETSMNAAAAVIDDKLGELASLIVGEDNAIIFKPVLREFVTALGSESVKEGFAASVRTLTDADHYARSLAETNSANDIGFNPGPERYQPRETVEVLAVAAREFAITANVTIETVRIEEGGVWRTTRNVSNSEARFLKIACVFRPASCRHVF